MTRPGPAAPTQEGRPAMSLNTEEEQDPEPDEDPGPFGDQEPHGAQEPDRPARTTRDQIFALSSVIIRCLTYILVEWIRHGGHLAW